MPAMDQTPTIAKQTYGSMIARLPSSLEPLSRENRRPAASLSESSQVMRMI